MAENDPIASAGSVKGASPQKKEADKKSRSLFGANIRVVFVLCAILFWIGILYLLKQFGVF